jgi:hypothetical protein
MAVNLSRRKWMLLTAAAAPAVGCSTSDVQEVVQDIDTDTLEDAAVVLRGYALVSCIVGPRVFSLPVPGVRVLAVFLVTSGIATKLVIEYLDVELRKRHVAEALSEEEVKAIESDLAVTFNLDNGGKESVPLGPNQYESESA